MELKIGFREEMPKLVKIDKNSNHNIGPMLLKVFALGVGIFFYGPYC
jgi:hypothetical protein